jgi:hypothetical protein
MSVDSCQVDRTTSTSYLAKLAAVHNAGTSIARVGSSKASIALLNACRVHSGT